MARLSWAGREAVVDHHEHVPRHALDEVPELGCADRESGNLIIQGDNLLAMRALLPDYAGKVKCLYVDPPYNTGTDGWVYDDSVESPAMRVWLQGVVGDLDMERRDRWLCMMYPRLRLAKALLSRNGLLAVSIDDRELSVLGLLLDEIFGAKNRLACAPWLAEPSGGKEKTGLRGGHEYLLLYHNGDDRGLTRETRPNGELNLSDRWGRYRKGRELTKWGGVSRREDRPGQWYSMRTPHGIEVWPIRNDGVEGHWRWGKDHSMRPVIEDPERAHWELRAFDEGVTWNGLTERWVPYEKIREETRTVGWSTWLDRHGYNADATRELKDILGHKAFDTPKPVALIRWFVSLHADNDALVLDAFAGSGTTAQAVLSLNQEDGGSRRFILIEMEQPVARNITAERVRRVVGGYGNPKGRVVPGLGGGFQYLEVGLRCD